MNEKPRNQKTKSRKSKAQRKDRRITRTNLAEFEVDDDSSEDDDDSHVLHWTASPAKRGRARSIVSPTSSGGGGPPGGSCGGGNECQGAYALSFCITGEKRPRVRKRQTQDV